jgi:Family of unknown function (DUF6011)
MNRTYSVDTLRQLAAGSEFYRDILIDFNRYGALTLAQVEALQEREVAPAQRPLDLPAAGVTPRTSSRLEAAIEHARSKGVAQPIIRVAGFAFMPADPQRARPENRDAIFVTTKERDGTYLGKVLKGSFLPSRDCTPALRNSVEDAIDDPYKAAVEFGHATGRCSICNKTLSNELSVKLGIGPICRAKFGW